jgi:hypothetical protein
VNVELVEPLNNRTTMFGRTSYQYVSSTPTSYSYPTPVFTQPSYYNLNLAVGAYVGNVEYSLYARNLTNQREIITINPQEVPNAATYTILPPRTIGLTLQYKTR